MIAPIPNELADSFFISSGLNKLTSLPDFNFAITSGKTQAQLEAELSKEAGQDADYLPKERAFRSEKDVFV